MGKSQKIFVAALLALILFLVYMETNQEEKINWTKSYTKQDKIPFGAYVLFSNLKKLAVDLQEIKKPPYEKLRLQEMKGTYFFLNEYVPYDEAELAEMLQWVEKGNTLFVSANHIGKKLLDTLNLKSESIYTTETIHTKPLLQLSNPSLAAEKPFLLDRNTQISVFSEIDTAKTKVLGFAEVYVDTLEMEDPMVNFVSQEFGKGEIILHLAPEAFSNYFLLSEKNLQYSEAALSYLNLNETIYWDSYYKVGKDFNTSLLYVLLSSRELKWAYYFVLIGAVLFIFFEGKRKQRPVPVIEPLKNQTHAYTRTIAGLYLEKKQYREIAATKIKLFHEYLRTQLKINQNTGDEQFYENVAAKSGNSMEDTKALFRHFSEIEKSDRITKEYLLKLSNKINAFKNR